MQNLYRESQNQSNENENENISPFTLTSTNVPFSCLSNQKLRAFKFNDEGKAKSRVYLKKLVMEIKAF